MGDTSKLGWVRVITRYVVAPVLAGALAALVASGVAAARPDADVGLMPLLGVAGAVLIAWIVAAVADRGPIVRRVLLPWAPCVLIIVIMIVVMLRPVHDNWDRDGQGLALLAYFAVLQLAAVLAMIGSAVAMAYHPGESPRPPT